MPASKEVMSIVPCTSGLLHRVDTGFIQLETHMIPYAAPCEDKLSSLALARMVCMKIINNNKDPPGHHGVRLPGHWACRVHLTPCSWKAPIDGVFRVQK